MFATAGNIALAAIGISFLIFIHEWGHFVAARIFGVRVETFSLGFGPKLWGFRRGETDYRLSAIPLGGYVKMAGEYGDYGDDVPLAADDLMAKPIWQRAIIFSGGVAVNFAFAFLAFPVVFALGVPMIPPVVGSMTPGGGAWSSGLQPGDEIVEIDGQPIYEFSDLRLEVALGDSTGQPARIVRDGRELELMLKPTRNTREGRYEIGILPADGRVIEVAEDSNAFEAGLRSEDLLVAVNDRPLAGDPDASKVLYALFQAGEPMRVTYEREGREGTATFTPTKRTREDILRIGVRGATTRVAGIRMPPEAVGGLGDDVHLRHSPLVPKDVVLAVGGTPVGSAEGIERALRAAPPGPLALTVRTDAGDVERILEDADKDFVLAGHVAFDLDDSVCRVQVIEGGAVADAGMRDGDVIRSLNGSEILDYEELVGALQDTDATRHALRFSRHGDDGGDRTITVDARPAVDQLADFRVRPHQERMKLGLGDAVVMGFHASINGLRTTWLTLTKLISGDVGAKNLGGIVTISVATYQIASSDTVKLIFFLALLSINLGFINILPIPVLDGGQILFLLFEKIKGARLSERFLNGSQLAGLVAILTLVVYVTYNDIARLFR